VPGAWLEGGHLGGSLGIDAHGTAYPDAIMLKFPGKMVAELNAERRQLRRRPPNMTCQPYRGLRGSVSLP
jgi:hypothetical protein